MTTLNRIFVVGHTGAGKFVFAEALAKRLNWQLVDANPGIERYYGRNLSDIFGKQGAQAFHQCEAEVISEYKTKNMVVVLLEEAVICSEQNRKLLSSEYVIYVKVEIPVQIQRWPDGRVPLLPIANLAEFLEKQHQERDELYEEVASFTVNSVTIEGDVDEAMQAIARV